MSLRDVIKAYVAGRGQMTAISTTVAASAINAVTDTRKVVTRRELEEMIAEEAIRVSVPIHFDSERVAAIAA